jgi:hypothetical protein
MTSLPLVSQGDGFIYNPLIAMVGFETTDFQWVQNEVVPVPFNSPFGTYTWSPPFYQYVNEDGAWQPPIAGWWQVSGCVRPYSGSGVFNHEGSLWLNGVNTGTSLLTVGGRQCVNAAYGKLVYLNGTTDYLQFGFYTDRPGPYSRVISSTQTYLLANYVRP